MKHTLSSLRALCSVAVLTLLSVGCTTHKEQWQASFGNNSHKTIFNVKMGIMSDTQGRFFFNGDIPQAVPIDEIIVDLTTYLNASGLWRIDGDKLYITVKDYSAKIPFKNVSSHLKMDEYDDDEADAVDFVSSIVEEFQGLSKIVGVVDRISCRYGVKRARRHNEKIMDQLLNQEFFMGTVDRNKSSLILHMNPELQGKISCFCEDIIFNIL